MILRDLLVRTGMRASESMERLTKILRLKRSGARQLELVSMEDRLLFSAAPGPMLVAPTPVAQIEMVVVASLDAPIEILSDAQPEAQLAGGQVSVLEQSQADGILTATTRELVFIDTGAENYQELLDDLWSHQDPARQIDVVLLSASEDGITQITETLAQYTTEKLDAVHFVTHGADRAIKLGNTWLDAAALDQNRDQIASWGEALQPGADLLIYGCDLAGNDLGRALLYNLVDLTGADIAASIDDTGSSLLGGDWDLEYEIGEVESVVAFTALAQEEYDGLLAAFSVTSTANSGVGTLRQAILDANALGGTDSITFAALGSGVHTINLTSTLSITSNILLDGYTATSYVNSPRIVLNGSTAPAGTSGITLASGGSGSTIRGLVIQQFTANGILLDNADNVTIVGNYIGTDITGQFDLGNGEDGIQLQNGASGNTIGGLNALDRNVISGNNNAGIAVDGVTTAGNTIIGNYVGLGSDGVTDLGNTHDGIHLQAATGTIIGGTTASSRNVISGNEINGIGLDSATGTSIQGNFIGTDSTGLLDRGNSSDGVFLGGTSTGNTIGTTGGGQNIISGNNQYGVNLTGTGATNNTIQNNYIGLNASGTGLIGNSNDGVILLNGASNNTIGGVTSAARNVISGNSDGVQVGGLSGGSNNNVIQFNYIGTDSTGTVDLGNNDDGVDIDNAALNNQVLNNLISGNTSDGIDLGDAGASTGTIIRSNLIGTQANGTSALGNSGHGILIGNGGTANNTTIGGTTAGQGNTIAHNSGDGVYVAASTSVSILGNAIFSNTELGIDLGTGGVTLNDPVLNMDSDIGANNLQNFPVLTRAVTNANNRLAVGGTLNSIANTSFRIEIYANITGDGTGNGEGQTYLGFVNVLTNSSGNVTWGTVLTGNVAAGAVISATATRLDAAFNAIETSEFASNITAVNSALVVTNTNDSGAGSLRAAITTANSTLGIDLITFNIGLSDANHVYYRNNGVAGTFGTPVVTTLADAAITDFDADYLTGTARSWYRIDLSGTDLNVTEAVIIDGSTQAGYDSAKGPIIELNATGISSGDPNGLTLTTGPSTIRGLVINRAGDDGIEIDVNAGGSTIVGSYIGTDVSGLQTTFGNGYGITVKSDGNLIGGLTVADRNVIGGNSTLSSLSFGIGFWQDSDNNIVQGNYIGVGADGTTAMGNRQGITFQNTPDNNLIGGTASGAGNIIANHSMNGIDVIAGTGNAVLGNTIFSNTLLGINLGTAGVTANDSGDGDSGANNLQNFPVLSTASTTGSQITITGAFNSTASTTFRVEFFASTAADGSGNGEGQRYLGFANVTTAASGNATFNTTLIAAVSPLEIISATATNTTTNSTSEFAQNIAASIITANSSSSAATVGAAGSLTWSHTVTSGNNRLLTVSLAFETGQSTGVTYGGVAMTLVGRHTGIQSHTSEIWQLVAPAVGTANIVATFNGTRIVLGGAEAFNNVNQTTPTGTLQGASDNSATASVNVASAPGELVIDSLYTDLSMSVTALAGQTEQWELTNSFTGAGSKEAGAAAVTMSWTLGTADEWNIGAVSLKPATATSSVALTAAQDSYINSSATTLNYGNATSLIVDRSGGSYGNQHILLQFDLSSIPVGATIHSATLQMQATANGGAINVNVYELTEAWVEGGGTGTAGAVNWTERSPGSNWSTAGGSFNGTEVATLNTGATGQHSWDLTALTQAWYAGTNVNRGVILASPDSGSSTITYDSSEGSTPPQLFVAYTMPPNVVPVITSNGGGATAAISVAENGTAVTTATATDSDIPAQSLTYTLSGVDQAWFTIHPTTGVLTFAAAPDFEAPTDAGGNNVYNVTVQVSDGAGGSDTQDLAVTVTNQAITTVSATGAATVTAGGLYTLNLAANEDATSWTINWGDGTIQTVAGDPGSVTHTYAAGNSGLTFSILASATDAAGAHFVNDLIAPTAFLTGEGLYRFTGPTGGFSQTFSGAELTNPYLAIVGPDGLLYVAGHGTDNVVRYNAATGALVDTFVTAGSGTLNGATGLAFGADGHLYVSSQINDKVLKFNGSTGAFMATFIATGSGGLNGPTHLTFRPDGYLYVGSYNTDSILRYNATTGAFVDTFVTAASGGLNGSASMVWGPDGNLYVASTNSTVKRYNGTTGAFIDNFITAGSGGLGEAFGMAFGPDGHLYVSSFTSDQIIKYNGTTGALIGDYVATGSGGLDGPAVFTFLPNQQVRVTAVNTSPTITSNGGGATASMNVAENATAVTTVTATDADLPAQTLTYTISGGVDAAKFAINTNTGVLTFATAPNFESPTDGGTNNIYDVIVQVSDGSLADTQAISVTVSNANDTPSNTVPGAQSTTTNTSIVFSTTNGNVIATSDPDAGTSPVQVTLSASNGTLTLPPLLPIGSETSATATPANNQYSPHVAVAGDGTYTVTWVSDSGIIARRFAADGTALTGDLQVSTTSAVVAYHRPQVGTDSSGNFVVSWSVQLTAGSNINTYMRRFAANGTALSAEQLVSTTAAQDQFFGDLAMRPTGEFVIAFSGNSAGDSDGVFFRQYSAAGVSGAVTLANLTILDDQTGPKLAYDASGNFSIVWRSGPALSTSAALMGRRFAANGSPLTGEFEVLPTTGGGPGIYAVGSDAAGNFTVLYGFGNLVNTELYARQFDSSGTALGASFMVNQTTAQNQDNADILMRADGSFVVVWESNLQDGSGEGVYQRSYNASGVATTNEILINTTTTNHQYSPSISANAAGQTVIAWSGNGVGDATGVFFQRFGLPSLIFSVGDGTSDATMTFMGTISDINTVLNGLTYTPNLGYTGSDSLAITTSDLGNSGSGGTLQDVDSVAITISAGPNTPPTMAFGEGNKTYTEGDAPLVIDATATVTDADGTDFNTGTLTVDFTVNANGDDRVTVRNQGVAIGQVGVSGTDITYNFGAGAVVIGTFSGQVIGTTPLVVTFNANATSTAVQAVARNVVFSDVSEHPNNSTRTVRFVVTDGDGGTSAAVTKQIIVDRINDAPLVSAPATLTVNEDGSGTLTISASDYEVNTLEVTLSVSQGTLTLASTAGLTFSVGDGTGDASLTFTGTTANLNAALSNFTYTPTPNYAGAEGIAWAVSDLGGTGLGGVQVTSGTVAVTVTAVNDAPTLNNGTNINLTTTNEDTPSSPYSVATLLASGGLGYADVDGGALTGMAITAATGGGNWQYSTDGLTWVNVLGVSTNNGLLLTGATQLRFNPDTQNGSSPTLVFRAWDQTTGTASTNAVPAFANPGTGGLTTAFSSSSANLLLTVTSVNDAPSISGGNLAAILEDTTNPAGATISSLIASSFFDVDAGASLSGIVVTSNNALVAEGVWQYSTDSGTNWFDVGTVGVNGLALDVSTQVRFLPAANFSGSPTILSLRGLDNSYAGGFTSGATRFLVDTTSPGGTSPISSSLVSINTSVTTVNDAPALTAGSVNNLTVLEDSGLTSLGLGSLSFSPGGGTDEAGQTLTYQITTIPHPTFFGVVYLADGTTPVTVSTYSLSQLQGMQFRPAANRNGGPSFFSFNVIDSGGTSNGGINTSGFSIQLNITPVSDAPVISTNTLSITEGATVVLSSSQINTTDPDTATGSLTYTTSSMTGGQFELVAASGVSITSFTQAQINAGAVQFVHNGGESAPSYALTVSDGSLSNGPSTVTIGSFTNINDSPSITTNTLSITEGATIVLTSANSNTTDPDNTTAQLTYTASGITGGQFELVSAPGTAITSFTQANINAGLVQFVHDGGGAAPSYQLTVSDGSLSDGPETVTIGSFGGVNDAPVIVANTLSISEGATVVLSNALINTTDSDNTPAQLTYTVSSLSGGQFELVASPGTSVTTFTQADINAGMVQFVHAGGEFAPTYQLAVSDGSLTDGPEMVTIGTFTNSNDGPVISANTLTITEGGTVLLGSGDLLTTDSDNTPSQLTYSITNIAGGQFESTTNPGMAVTTYTQADVIGGTIVFVHDGGDSAPTYKVTVSDGTVSVGPSTVSGIAFTSVNDAPVMSFGQGDINYTEGDGSVLVDTLITVSDVDSSDFAGGTLTVSISGGDVNDHMWVTHQGTGVGQVSVIGTDVYSNSSSGSVLIGAISGAGSSLSPLVVTFNASATATDVAMVARAVVYSNYSTASVTTDRTVQCQLTDGDSGNSAAITKLIHFSSVNTAPSISSPPAVATAVNTAITFLLTNGNAISVADVDAGSSSIQVRLTVSSGQLTLSGTSGLSFSVGDGFSDATMTLTGSVLDINTALEGMVYTPIAAFNGADRLLVEVNDLGNSGTISSPLTSTRGVNLYVGTVPFLQGDYLEVGFNGAGALGSTLGAPTGFQSAGSPLAVESDPERDGGTYDGDFILPGSPEEGWGLHVGGSTYSNNTLSYGADDIVGTWGSIVDDGQSEALTWTGAVGGLAISSQHTVQQNGLYLEIVVTLTNNTGAALNDLYYYRNVDPDNNYDHNSQFETTNTIISQGNDGSGVSQVSATQPDSTFMSLTGFGADSRVAYGGFSNRDPLAIYNGSSGLSQSGIATSDEAIALAFRVATLAAGDSTTLTLRYTFGNQAAPDLDLDANNSTATGIGYQGLFIEGGGPVAIVDTDMSMFDADDHRLTGMTLTLTNPLDGVLESLAATTTGTNITALYNSGTGVLALSGTDTLAHYRQVLASVVYDNTDDTPDTTSRVITITATDGVHTSPVATSTIDVSATNDAPVFVTNTLTLSEGASVVLTNADLNSSDMESGPTGLTYTVSGLTAGQFELIPNGTSITSFTQDDINNGRVRFVHDGGEAAPTYSLTLSDGGANVGPSVATISFTNVNDAPAMGGNTLSISEGGTVVLGLTNISATDPDNTPAQLAYTASNVSHGQFEYVATPGAAITTFTQADINAGLVQFVHDGSDIAPAYDLTVSDGSLSHGPSSASVTFNASNDLPTISTVANQTISEDTTLGPIAVTVGDSETAATALVVTATSSDGTRIPSGNIVLGGSGTNRTITITPALNQYGGPVTITLTVNDGVATTQMAFEVTVIAVNDAPTISPATMPLSETAINGSLIGSVVSDDVDVGDTRTFSIIGGDPLGAFSIDNTGRLFVADQVQLDYETVPTWSLTVQVRDAAGATATAVMTINLIDENDNTPVITSNGVGDTASVTLTENNTLVTTVVATDVDAGTVLTYGIFGDDVAFFQIDTSTGELTFQLPPDYETPHDMDGDNVYEVSVIATDGTRSDVQSLSITITDANEFATTAIVDQDLSTEIVLENAIVGTPVGITAFADEMDGTDAVSYSLLNDASGRFAIDASTGIVNVAGSIDYESAASHTIRVQALSTDGSSSIRDFTITVVDVNEFATTPVSDTDTAIELLAENVVVGTPVGVTAFADDLDGTDVVSYSLTNNAGGRFVIDAVAGIVRLNAALNYEAATTHTIQVQAQSTDGSTSVRDFMIVVTDVNEFATTAISDTDVSADQVAENASVGTPVGVTAFADDLDGTDTVSYSLLNNAGGRFAIDNTTGVVTVNAALDYEASTSHTIRMQALSTDGSTSIRDYTIAVIDVNEFATTPVSDTNAVIDQVSENARVGTLVGATAFADDLDGTDGVSYSLTSNAGGRFAIDPITGAVTVAGAIDYEATSTLSFTVQALSTDGSLTTRDFVIVVTDLNDNAPVIGPGQTFSLPENSANSTPVGTVVASDVDTMGTLQTWTITGGTGAGAFAINAATGEITVLDGSLLNYEATPSFTLLVTVSDGVATSAVQTITIDLTNVNEAPQITGPANTSVNEDGTTAALPVTISDVDTAANTLVVTATSSDLALIPNGNIVIGGTGSNRTVTITPTADMNGGPVTITLTVSDGALSTQTTFLVVVNAVNDAPTISVVPDQTINEDTTTGPLSITIGEIDSSVNGLVVSATSSDQGLIPDGNLIISGTGASRTITVTPTADQNGGPVTITLTVSDGALTTQRTFTVIVASVNDLPVIVPQGFTVDENSLAGAVVGTVLASDIDTGAVLTFTIDSGNDNGAFTINSSTGEITVANPSALNFEIAQVFLLTVSVTDSVGAPQTTTITIRLLDLNEVPTSLDLSSNSVIENSFIGTQVGQLSSTDVDTGDSATYSLFDDAGGLFTVDANTGEITVNGSLDFETSANHTIIARITDSGGLVLDRSFVISLVDLNEAPVLVGAAYGLSENSINGTVIGTLSASDVDAGDQLTFSLISGNTSGAFSIDAISGAITVANTAAIDFEANGTFTLTAQVADRAGLIHQQVVTVNLSDVNERPSVLTGIYHINEWSSIGSLVGMVAASDVDAGDTLSYSFVAGNTGGRFAIDPSTGEITVANGTGFTHETQSSYTMSVEVQDVAGLTHSADMTVIVDNVNEPPVAVNDQYAVNQFATFTTATINGVLVNDGDSDSPLITASFVQGPRNGTLTLNLDGTFTYVPDGLYFGLDAFTYIVNDGLESSSVATVSLTVNLVAPGGGGLGGDPDSFDEQDDAELTDDDEETGHGVAGNEPAGTGEPAHGSGSTSTSRIVVSSQTDSSTGAGLLSTVNILDDFFRRHSSLIDPRSVARHSSSPRSGLVNQMRRIPDLLPVIQEFMPAPLQDLTFAILENHSMWNELNTIRHQMEDQQQSSMFAENIVVGTTTAVTGGLTVGYVIWLIRGGSLLATMVSVIPTWASFDPLPVMDRFEEEKSEEDQESLASIVSGI